MLSNPRAYPGLSPAPSGGWYGGMGHYWQFGQ